jgi:hypothetical protein
VVSKSPGEPKPKKTKRGAPIDHEVSPEIPDGEDDMSYERHVKSLKTEWQKKRPNEEFCTSAFETFLFLQTAMDFVQTPFGKRSFQ